MSTFSDWERGLSSSEEAETYCDDCRCDPCQCDELCNLEDYLADQEWWNG